MYALPIPRTSSTFHSRTVPSAEHDARRSPDGAKRQAYTTPWCPRRVYLLNVQHYAQRYCTNSYVGHCRIRDLHPSQPFSGAGQHPEHALPRRTCLLVGRLSRHLLGILRGFPIRVLFPRHYQGGSRAILRKPHKMRAYLNNCRTEHGCIEYAPTFDCVCIKTKKCPTCHLDRRR